MGADLTYRWRKCQLDLAMLYIGLDLTELSATEKVTQKMAIEKELLNANNKKIELLTKLN